MRSRRGLSERGLRSDLSARSGRSVLGPRLSRCGRSDFDFLASFSVTPVKGLSSINCRNVAFCDLSRCGTTERTVMPSISKSASILSWSPTFDSLGKSEDSTTPLGTLAPAARHVHVPSSRVLVNSISRRLDMSLYGIGKVWICHICMVKLVP